MKYPVNKNLTIESGETLCTTCNGWGYTITDHENAKYKLCSKCLGRCVLDWIDAVIGKNRDPRWA